MALSYDLHKGVVDAVVAGGISRNAGVKRFGVSVASAVHWVCRYDAADEISPGPTGADQRSDQIEALRDYTGVFLETAYDAKHIHSVVGYKPPDEFEAEHGWINRRQRGKTEAISLN